MVVAADSSVAGTVGGVMEAVVGYSVMMMRRRMLLALLLLLLLLMLLLFLLVGPVSVLLCE